jgi:hypothetical protein
MRSVARTRARAAGGGGGGAYVRLGGGCGGVYGRGRDPLARCASRAWPSPPGPPPPSRSRPAPTPRPPPPISLTHRLHCLRPLRLLRAAAATRDRVRAVDSRRLPPPAPTRKSTRLRPAYPLTSYAPAPTSAAPLRQSSPVSARMCGKFW